MSTINREVFFSEIALHSPLLSAVGLSSHVPAIQRQRDEDDPLFDPKEDAEARAYNESLTRFSSVQMPTFLEDSYPAENWAVAKLAHYVSSEAVKRLASAAPTKETQEKTPLDSIAGAVIDIKMHERKEWRLVLHPAAVHDIRLDRRFYERHMDARLPEELFGVKLVIDTRMDEDTYLLFKDGAVDFAISNVRVLKDSKQDRAELLARLEVDAENVKPTRNVR